METSSERQGEAIGDSLGEATREPYPTRVCPETTASTDSRDLKDAKDARDVKNAKDAPDGHETHDLQDVHGAINAREGSWIETVERFARQSGIDVLVAGLGTDRYKHEPCNSAVRKNLEEKGSRRDFASNIPRISCVPRIWCVYRERGHGRIMALVLVLKNRSDGAVWQPCFQHEGPFCLDIPGALFELLTPPSAWNSELRNEESEAVFWYRAAEKDVHERVMARTRTRLQGHAKGVSGAESESRGGGEWDGRGKGTGHDDPGHTVAGNTALADVRNEIERHRFGAGRARGNMAHVRRSRGICENVHLRVKPLFD